MSADYALCYRWWKRPSDDHYCELPAGHEGTCVCACGETNDEG